MTALARRAPTLISLCGSSSRALWDVLASIWAISLLAEGMLFRKAVLIMGGSRNRRSMTRLLRLDRLPSHSQGGFLYSWPEAHNFRALSRE